MTSSENVILACPRCWQAIGKRVAQLSFSKFIHLPPLLLTFTCQHHLLTISSGPRVHPNINLPVLIAQITLIVQASPRLPILLVSQQHVAYPSIALSRRSIELKLRGKGTFNFLAYTFEHSTSTRVRHDCEGQ